jgi:hypothetical protein
MPDRTGKTFEDRVERLLRLIGFKVERNQKVRGTQVDLVARRDDPMAPVTYLVECTDKSRPVGIEYVKEKAGSLLNIVDGARIIVLTIVAPNGFSAEAKEFAESRPNLVLRTIGELEADLIQFEPYRDGYLQHYENSTGIFKDAQLYNYYVEPTATATEGDATGPIESMVRDWLGDEENNVLFILGDYGAGKTSFLRQFAYKLLSAPAADDGASSPVPILIPLREYRQALNIRQVITDTLLNDYEVRLSSFRTFEHFCSLGRALLLLDGFDEMAAQSDPATLFDCLAQIFILAEMDVKVVVTCRSNFFRSHYQLFELLREFAIELPRLGSTEVDKRPLGRHGGVITIKPLSPSQIRSFIARRLPGEVDEYLGRIAEIHDLSDLCKRPVLLDMILSTLPSFGPGEVVNSAALYEHYTDKWVRKDQWRVSMSRELRHALCDALAWTMLARGMKDISYLEIRKLIAATLSTDQVDEAQLEKYANDLQTCSFLVRGGSDEGYEFAHKSFTEFFTGRRIARALTEGSKLPDEEERALPRSRSRDGESVPFSMSLSSESLLTFRDLLDVRLERAGAWSTFDFLGPEPVRGASRESIGAQLERRVTSLFDVEDASMAHTRLPFNLTPEIATFALEWLQINKVSFDSLVEKAPGPGELKTLVELIKHGSAPDFFASNEKSFTKHLRQNNDPQFSAALAGALVTTGYIRSPRIISAMRDALTPRAFNYVAYVIAEDGDEVALTALSEYTAGAEVDTLTSLIVTFGLRKSLPPDDYTNRIIESIQALAAEGEDPELVAALADSTANDAESLYDIVEAILLSSTSENTQLRAVKLLDGVGHEKTERRLRRMWTREEVSGRPRKVLQRLEERHRSAAATEQDRQRWRRARGGQVRDSLWRSLQP